MVLFDCDGVLVDSEPLTTLIMRDNLARYGLDIPLDRVVDLFVGGTMPGVEKTARNMGAALPDDWLDEIYAEMFDRLGQEVEEIPGISSVLDVLDTYGIKYAVCSNGPHAKMQVTLKKTGLLARFGDAVFSREDVASPKPAPDVYLHAAQKFGVPARKCVVVEDSESGAKAGQAAGMMTLGYAAATATEILEPVCDQVFADMARLPTLLDQPIDD
ncbi:MAG: HAD family phosphatase [Pseudomonadota bacterium]